MKTDSFARGTFGVLLLALLGCAPPEPSESTTATAPKAAAVPDLNGLWQAVGTAHWNLEGGHAIKGPATIVLGALGGIPAGYSYVEGGEIPYTEEARTQREEYRAEWNQ